MASYLLQLPDLTGCGHIELGNYVIGFADFWTWLAQTVPDWLGKRPIGCGSGVELFETGWQAGYSSDGFFYPVIPVRLFGGASLLTIEAWQASYSPLQIEGLYYNLAAGITATVSFYVY